MEATNSIESGERDEAIRIIRENLKRASGKTWSVTGGRGTAWGWILIQAPPARRVGGVMTDEERAEFGLLLGLDGPAHCQGVNVPAGGDYRIEYCQRSRGIVPTVRGVQYWD